MGGHAANRFYHTVLLGPFQKISNHAMENNILNIEKNPTFVLLCEVYVTVKHAACEKPIQTWP